MQHSRLHQLELSHDGLIPPRLREAAAILDAAEAATRKPAVARIRTNVVRLTRKGEVEQLAMAMAAIAATRGAATRADLTRRGFTEAQLDRYGAAARVRAAEIRAEREAGR